MPHSHRGIQLLDGDRIAVLAATLINRILQGRPAALPDPNQQDQLAGNESFQVRHVAGNSARLLARALTLVA